MKHQGPFQAESTEKTLLNWIKEDKKVRQDYLLAGLAKVLIDRTHNEHIFNSVLEGYDNINFINNSPKTTQQALWQETGKLLAEENLEQPKWLSTHGTGVYHLHVRINDVPKYYHWDKYKTIEKVEVTSSENEKISRILVGIKQFIESKKIPWTDDIWNISKEKLREELNRLCQINGYNNNTLNGIPVGEENKINDRNRRDDYLNSILLRSLKFTDFFGENQLTAYYSTGDGNCFYNSFSLLINGNEDLMSALRLETLREIIQDRCTKLIMMQDSTNQEYASEEEVEILLDIVTLGRQSGGIEQSALAKLLDCNIMTVSGVDNQNGGFIGLNLPNYADVVERDFGIDGGEEQFNIISQKKIIWILHSGTYQYGHYVPLIPAEGLNNPLKLAKLFLKQSIAYTDKAEANNKLSEISENWKEEINNAPDFLTLKNLYHRLKSEIWALRGISEIKKYLEERNLWGDEEIRRKLEEERTKFLEIKDQYPEDQGEVSEKIKRKVGEIRNKFDNQRSSGERQHPQSSYTFYPNQAGSETKSKNIDKSNTSTASGNNNRSNENPSSSLTSSSENQSDSSSSSQGESDSSSSSAASPNSSYSDFASFSSNNSASSATTDNFSGASDFSTTPTNTKNNQPSNDASASDSNSSTANSNSWSSSAPISESQEDLPTPSTVQKALERIQTTAESQINNPEVKETAKKVVAVLQQEEEEKTNNSRQPITESEKEVRNNQKIVKTEEIEKILKVVNKALNLNANNTQWDPEKDQMLNYLQGIPSNSAQYQAIVKVNSQLITKAIGHLQDLKALKEMKAADRHPFKEKPVFWPWIVGSGVLIVAGLTIGWGKLRKSVVKRKL